MEGSLRHRLNGVALADEPGGWADFTEDLDRDLDERIIYLKYPNTLNFVGDGYWTLRRLFEENYCNEVDYTLEQFCNGGWDVKCECKIILSDVVWNLSKCTADTPITDTAVGARILNNKSVTAFALATLSKSGVAITPVPPIDLEVYDPAANEATYLATKRIAYDWKLCMQHLLAFITDGLVGFRSDWYDALPDDERFCLVNGVNLRTASIEARPPEYSFRDLWEFAWKSDNLMAGIEQTEQGPVFRVETEAFWYAAPGSIILLDQEDIEQSIDTDLLYASVKMGSQGAIKNEAIAAKYSLPYVGLRTFSEESYALEGQCNTDNALDLELPFIVCTNAIEDAVVNNDDGNDDEVFVIQYDRTNSKAVKRSYLTSDAEPWLYNERFLNLNVVRRWRLPASGVTYYADEDAAFRAERTVVGGSYDDIFNTFGSVGSTQVDARFQFDNDYTLPNFDTSNVWGNGTTPGDPVSNANSRFTAPARLLVGLEVQQIVRVTDYVVPSGVPFTFLHRVYVLPTIKIRHYNSANVLLNEYVFTVASPGQAWSSGVLPPISATGEYANTVTQEIYMQTNDYVEVWFKGETWIQSLGVGNLRLSVQQAQGPYPITSGTIPEHYVRYELSEGSYVRTVYVATFGGEVITATPEEFYSTKLEFSRSMDNVGWSEIRSNFAAAMQVAHDSSTLRIGYPRAVSRKLATGDTEWELIANRDQPNP